jgi:sialic acid synthase SpsE
VKFKQKFRIEKRDVGQGAPVFVIAEAGSNHDGSLAQAKKLIDAAADAGADAVKFQSYSGPGLVNQSVLPEVYEIIKMIATPKKWLASLAAHARKRGIVFMSTPFDEEQLQALEDAGVSAYKIASGDLTNLPFIREIAKRKKPIFLSVGCGTLADVERAVETVYAAGNDRLVIMHCIVSYPTAWEDANVAVLWTLEDAFGCPVGYSDHSAGDLVPVLAVAHGACAIEKHITFSRALPGPDHAFAMEMSEFRDMVEKIHAVPAVIGSPQKQILPCEKEELYYARRCLYAARNIASGETITRDVLHLVRPAVQGAITPSHLDNILGRKAVKDIKALAPIMWDCI